MTRNVANIRNIAGVRTRWVREKRLWLINFSFIVVQSNRSPMSTLAPAFAISTKKKSTTSIRSRRPSLISITPASISM